MGEREREREGKRLDTKRATGQELTKTWHKNPTTTTTKTKLTVKDLSRSRARLGQTKMDKDQVKTSKTMTRPERQQIYRIWVRVRVKVVAAVMVQFMSLWSELWSGLELRYEFEGK